MWPISMACHAGLNSFVFCFRKFLVHWLNPLQYLEETQAVEESQVFAEACAGDVAPQALCFHLLHV